MAIRKSILGLVQKILPPISQTEREALESGTVGWDAQLINGAPDWKELFKYKKPQLTPEEQAFLDGPTEQLCKMLDKWQIQKDNDLPKPVWDFIKDQGFMGLEIKKEYGGHGFSKQLHSAVVMKLASRSVVGAVTVMVPNSLGPGELLTHYGTDEQKKHYLPRLANGREVPCFALTEPDAGSDAGSMDAKGTVFKDEAGKLQIKLDFSKRYITLAPVATLIGLAFKLEDPDNLLGKGKNLGITVALVPRETPGVEAGSRHNPMDLSFMNGTVSGKGAVISVDNIIGGPEMAGKGWKMLMESLSVGRSLSLPALATSGAKLTSAVTGAYSRVRKQFSLAIGKFQGVEKPIGRMAAETYLMDAARLATIQMVEQGERPAVPSAILKYHLTEKNRAIVNDGMDVLGGKAVMNGPGNMLADMYKGIPVAITVEGANIMTRNLIINGQGLVRSNKYLLKIMEAVNDKDYKKGFAGFVKNSLLITGQTVASTVKSFVYGITNGLGALAPSGVDGKTKKYYRRIKRLSAAFNAVANPSAMLLGGQMKREENLSARLGDVTSNLYLASTALLGHENKGRPQDDLPLLHLAVTNALHKAEDALAGALKNHPLKDTRLFDARKPLLSAAMLPVNLLKKVTPYVLPLVVFPLGKRMAEVTDKMETAAAQVILEPTAARERLVAGIYRPASTDEQMGLLETAFKHVSEVEPLEKKLARAAHVKAFPRGKGREETLGNAVAAGVITAAESGKLAEADSLRKKVVAVDVFKAA